MKRHIAYWCYISFSVALQYKKISVYRLFASHVDA